MSKKPTSKNRQESFDNFLKDIADLINKLEDKKVMSKENAEQWYFYISIMRRYSVK